MSTCRYIFTRGKNQELSCENSPYIDGYCYDCYHRQQFYQDMETIKTQADFDIIYDYCRNSCTRRPWLDGYCLKCLAKEKPETIQSMSKLLSLLAIV